MAKYSWIAAIVVAIAVALATWPDGSSRGPSGRFETLGGYDASAPRLRRGIGAVVDRIPKERAPRPQPSSLRGTEVDGALPVGPDGRLIPSPDVIRFFDYFFVTSGEVADSVIEARIREEIARRLEEPARGDALTLLAKYLTYRFEAMALYADQGESTVGERISSLAELRDRVFGDDADTLFGPDLKYAAVAAEMQRVASDADLSEAERAGRLAELEADLPEEVREARAAAVAPLDLARAEAELRAEGGSEGEVRALREERFGVAAADRLEELDRRREQWRGRIDDFRRERSVIEADTTLSEEQRQAKIAELLNSSFDEREQRRVAALDRIELVD